jgi:hypothetical protein
MPTENILSTKIVKSVLILLFLFVSMTCRAASRPTEVAVGIYVNQIYNVSLKDNRFTADFYIWFRYEGDNIKPVETMEVVNGKIDSKTGVMTKKINGINYSICRVVATINKFWDVSRYPLDKHTLQIEIEDSINDSEVMGFSPDTKNSALSPDAQVRGWKVVGTQSFDRSKEYISNFGDISLPSNSQSTYSRYVYAIDLERVGLGQFFKLFVLMFLATLVAFLAFLVTPTSGPRFGLGTGALFAAAANSFVVGSSLPDSNGITMADLLQLTTIGLIFISLFISTVSLRLFTTGQEKMSQKIDKISIALLPPFYALFVLWMVFDPLH